MFSVGPLNAEFLILWEQHRLPDFRAAGIDDGFPNYVSSLRLLRVGRDACDLSPKPLSSAQPLKLLLRTIL